MAKTKAKPSQAVPPAPQADEGRFAVPFRNYRLMLIGLGIIVLGFILMVGGGAGDPTKEYSLDMFSFRRITLAPVIIMAGFILEMVAIMRRPKASKE